MLLLIPYLFPSARLLEAAAQDLRLPALQTLLARGTRQPCPAEGVEAALCEALGIARQQDWPLAPITLAADGGMAGDAYWLRADPVHLQVMRDRIVLADSGAFELTQLEADALAAAIGQHFGADLSPNPLHPKRWYLRLPHAPRLTTTPLSVAVGRDIDPLLPQGGDAMRFRAQLNELQMLLHDHPVNQAREARGDLPVNSLWLWGGGCLPAARAIPVPIYAGNAEAQALAALCSADVHALPSHLDAQLLETNGVMLLDALTRAGQVGDAYGWREALRELEQDWFVPLLGTLRKIGPHGLRLIDPVNGKILHLHTSDAWKFWRRPQPLISMLA
ncbi:MAG: hypothetical protein Q8K35_03910 [Thiobacillus sp.]|nr:hypothetical protein [Thiobacillus sp.]MDP2056892.1 hypothetical protein [Thiobacillus sp.]